jgi:hypothetical protein
LTKDRVEEAEAAFYKFREGCVSDEEIATEFEALQLALRLEPEQGKYSTYWEALFFLVVLVTQGSPETCLIVFTKNIQ